MKTFYLHSPDLSVVTKGKQMTRISKKQPRYTVAGIFNEVNQQFHFGVARCSVLDQFVKRIGRIKAEGRAKSKHNITYQIQPGEIKDNKIGTLFVEKAIELIQLQ